MESRLHRIILFACSIKMTKLHHGTLCSWHFNGVSTEHVRKNTNLQIVSLGALLVTILRLSIYSEKSSMKMWKVSTQVQPSEDLSPLFYQIIPLFNQNIMFLLSHLMSYNKFSNATQQARFYQMISNFNKVSWKRVLLYWNKYLFQDFFRWFSKADTFSSFRFSQGFVFL